jgi:hypothetical protein
MARRLGAALAATALVATIGLGLTLAPAQAQTWPAKPLRLIVPYPPGGIGDTFSRSLAQQLSERLGQPVLIENKPGASQIIGAEQAAKAAPDGYTLFLGSVTSLVINVKAVKLPADKWAATVGPDLDVAASIDVISFDVDVDGAKSSIAIASGSLSSPYVEVIDHRDGVGWLPARLAELVLKFSPTVVGVNGAGPAGAQVGPVLSAFAEAGISADLLVQLNTNAFKQACGGFYSDVIEGRLRRPAGQGPLDVAAGDAAERVLGDAWAWDRRSSAVPISPLVAVTVARALLPTAPAETFYDGGFHDLDDFTED